MNKPDIVSRYKAITSWLKENKAIGVALLILMLCFGLMENLVELINKTLLHITDIKSNVWLDWLFVIITVYLWISLYRLWILKRKRVTPRGMSLLLVPTVLYVYFRFSENSTFSFTPYWNSPIYYLDGFACVCIVIIGLFLWQQFSQFKKQNTESGYAFDIDAPIKASDQDLFNMEGIVKRIVNYIAFTDVSHTAFSMGLIGEWGDGKTSLMNLVEEKIRAQYRDFIIVHFNPRASRRASYIQEDFLESLKQSLSPIHSGIDRTIDKYAVALDVIPGLPPIVSKGLEILQVRKDKDREIKRGELKKAILDLKRRIVVLIDDLDRLTGEELIEVMKVLDTNGAFPNMVFVTSFDKGYVNSVLNNYLNIQNQSRAYTDKYFTVEIRVPLHPSFRLMNYLVKLLVDASNNGFIKLKAEDVEQRTKALSAYIMPRLKTIRDIKRFANQFLYDYAEVQREVSYRDYFLLELIKFAHPDDYEALYRLRYIHRGQSSFLTPSSDELLYLSDKLLPRKSANGDSMEEPEIRPESMDILSVLFPEEDNYQNWYGARYQRIFCASSFEFYFYNYEYSHLKADDIDRLFKEQDITAVCKLIDSWADFSKDLETYLLTRDVFSISNKNVLRRYMQLLLYSDYKFPSFNYPGHNYSFLRKEDVDKICRKCGFSSIQDYMVWFKESMAELFAINPIIPSNYLHTPISGLYSDKLGDDFFIMSQHELQEYALDLLKDYLKKVDTEGWDINTAYIMAQIQGDEKGYPLPEACKELHDCMVGHFNVFSATLPYFASENDNNYVGYNGKLRFRAVFEDRDEFERLINSDDNKDAQEIELIKAIWPIYKNNECYNFVLPKGISMEEAKKSQMKSVLLEFDRYNEIDKEIEKLAEEWKQGHQVSDVDVFTKRAQGLLKELRAIPLRLKIAEKYELEIHDMINQFQEFGKIGNNPE